MLGGVTVRDLSTHTPEKDKPARDFRLVSDGDSSTIAASSGFLDIKKTPKARRKSDIHDLLPEMLSRHETESCGFRVLRVGESLSDTYAVKVAFYTVGAKSITRCTELSSGQTYVMKRRQKDAYGSEIEKHWRRVMERIIRMDPHPNVVALREIVEDDEAFYIVMEECTGGQLFDLLLLESAMTQRECKRIIREILGAVNHLHDNGLIHRDIKPENLMLSSSESDSRIVLIDFDTCEEIGSRRLSMAISPSDRPLRRRSSRVIGTLGYIAPECFNGEYSAASDLFSVGVIFYTLMTGDLPFDDSIYESQHGEPHESDELQVAGSPKSKRVHRGLTSANVDWNVSPWPQLSLAKGLCQRLIQTDPDERISSCKEALEHPWLATAYPATPFKSNI